MADITIVDNPDERRYEAFVDGAFAGMAVYQRRADRIVFLHTEVDDAFEGHGVGGQLARFALDDARERHLGVVPRCPFIRAYIERHPEYQDLVAAS